MTQADLARKVGCSAKTIAKIELGERRPSKQLTELLADALEVPDEQRPAFLRAARGLPESPGVPTRATQTVDTQSTAACVERHGPQTPNNLPVPLTEFIGRERLTVEVVAMLRRPYTRLVTLTGMGGVGKTRLAIEVARELQDEFRDGVFFVALAVLSDPALVLPAIAQVLEVKARVGQPVVQALIEYLRGRETLLVLDNLEQVLAAGPQVAELLSGCASLKALVTSREGLHVRGEKEVQVPPLSLPESVEEATPESVLQSEAGRLFVERARDARAGFNVSAHEAPSVARICAQLDGVPLAIELVAVRIKRHGGQDLLGSGDSRLGAAVGPLYDLPARQRTLRDTIAWSYDLLDEAEQRVFRRLGVFVGGCSLEAVEAVGMDGATGEWDMLRRLESLVDKSLLRYDLREARPETPRFEMLETIREYALEKLRDSGEEVSVRQRHEEYFGALAERAEQELYGPAQADWLNLLDSDIGNLRAAMEYGGPGATQRIAGPLYLFWQTRSYVSELRDRLHTALAAPDTEERQGEERGAALTRRVRALNTAAALAWIQGDLQEARAFFTQGLHLYRDMGDKTGIARLLNNVGLVEFGLDNVGRAEELFAESLAIHRELGNKRHAAQALANIGSAAQVQGHYARARASHEESLALCEEIGNKLIAADSLFHLGLAERDLGNPDRAYDRFQQSLALSREAGGDHRVTALALNGLGMLARLEGDYVQARALLTDSLSIARKMGDNWVMGEVLLNLAHVAMAEGKRREAGQLVSESLGLARNASDLTLAAPCLEAAAMLAHVQGDYERAARLWGAAARVRATNSTVAPPADRAQYEQSALALRGSLGDKAWTAAYQEGREMDPAQALTFALEDRTR